MMKYDKYDKYDEICQQAATLTRACVLTLRFFQVICNPDNIV